MIGKARDTRHQREHLTELFDLATKRQDETPVTEIYEAINHMSWLTGGTGPSILLPTLEMLSKLRHQRPEDRAFLDPSPLFERLWQDILYVLPCVDLPTTWYLTDSMVKLQLPTDRYGVLASHELMGLLSTSGNLKSGNELAAYLILVDRAVQWGRAPGEQFKE